MIENTMEIPAGYEAENTESITSWLFLVIITFGLYAFFAWVFRGFKKEIPNHAEVKTYEQAWAQVCEDYPEWTQKSKVAQSIESAGYELN